MNKISKKIDTLNKVVADLVLFTGDDEVALLKKITNESVKIFEANSAVAYQKPSHESDYRLIYKKQKPSIHAKRQVSKINDVSVVVKYGDRVYGKIILSFNKEKKFTKEETALVDTLGNVAAQALTINWLVEKEQKNLTLAEKQKEVEVLLAQEKLRTEFIANATHELRTPLAIMKGNVDLALMSKGDQKATREALKEINEEINILSQIMKDLALLTSSTKNAEDMIVQAPVNLRNLVSKTAGRLKKLASDEKISVKLNPGKKEKLFVLGDEGYLEKLFLNLIKNAITYGKQGGKIEVSVLKDKSKAKVIVKDNGIGISREDLPRVFERFYRADKSHSAHGTHSGLGLPIAKWVAEIHGGTIDVESKEGKGSAFTVTLPLIKA